MSAPRARRGDEACYEQQVTRTQPVAGALVLLGMVCLLAGVVALALGLTDSVSAAGLAAKLGGLGIAIGFAAVMGGFLLKKP